MYTKIQNPREASSRSRIFLFSFVNMCVYVSVRRLLATTKKDTDLKFGTHTPLDFRKSDPKGRPLALKNCRVTWIFRIAPRLPCFVL